MHCHDEEAFALFFLLIKMRGKILLQENDAKNNRTE